jgi:hypothetical protein
MQDCPVCPSVCAIMHGTCCRCILLVARLWEAAAPPMQLCTCEAAQQTMTAGAWRAGAHLMCCPGLSTERPTARVGAAAGQMHNTDVQREAVNQLGCISSVAMAANTQAVGSRQQVQGSSWCCAHTSACLMPVCGSWYAVCGMHCRKLVGHAAAAS